MTASDDDAFEPMTPDQSLRAAQQTAAKSVQSSLWRHLKTAGFARAGSVSWVLVRAGQRDNPRRAGSLAALEKRPLAELESLLDVLRKARASRLANEHWIELIDAITQPLEAIVYEKTPATEYSPEVMQKFREAMAVHAPKGTNGSR